SFQNAAPTRTSRIARSARAGTFRRRPSVGIPPQDHRRSERRQRPRARTDLSNDEPIGRRRSAGRCSPIRATHSLLVVFPPCFQSIDLLPLSRPSTTFG